MLTNHERRVLLAVTDLLEAQGRTELRNAMFDMAGRLAAQQQTIAIAKAACAHLVATGPCDDMDPYDSSCDGCNDAACTYCALARVANRWRAEDVLAGEGGGT